MRTIRGIAWAAGVVMAAACGGGSDVTAPPGNDELACVNPAAAGAAVTCSAKLPVKATVKVVLTSHQTCEAQGDFFATTAPVADTLTVDGCFDTVGKEIDLGPFDAGATLSAEIKPGILFGGGSGRAAVQVTGQYPSWTVKVEDALDAFAGQPNDYDDIVVTVTVVPS